MNNKSFYIVIAILLITAVIALGAYFREWSAQGDEPQVSEFPMVVGEWEGKDYPIDERTYEVLETRNLFIRDYRNSSGEIVNLYIVYSKDNRRAMHPPEICLTGGGLEILNKSKVQMTGSIKAVQLLTEKNNVREVVEYWYKAGSLNTENYMKQQLKIMIDRLIGKNSSGAMIRLSTVIKNGKELEAKELLKKFTQEIELLIEKYVP